MKIESVNNSLTKKEIDLTLIYDKLDYDEEINRLLSKVIDNDRGPVGENIWPSNFINLVDGILKIDARNFDFEIQEVKKQASQDNDLQRIEEIERISQNKNEIFSLIRKKLKSLGYEIEVA